MKESTSRPCFVVAPEDLRQLTLLAQTAAGRMAARAQVVLLSAQGLTVERIASELSIVPPTVYKWRRRFAERGIAGLYDLPRPGQPLKLDDQRKRAMMRLITEAVPEDALEWSIRRLAKVARVTEHQARSVLQRSRRSPSDRSGEAPGYFGHSPSLLGAVCLAAPVVGALISVENERTATDASLGGVHDRAEARLTRYHNEPQSSYRAFRASESAAAPRELRAAQLVMAFGELSDVVHPGRRLELIIAPAGAFGVALTNELCPRVRVVALETVCIWLRTFERYLLCLEEPALATEASESELTKLRACLAEHSTHAAPGSGSEFFWRNSRWHAASDSPRR
ncbi:MAG TPA: helix-turn-helix domain-containing protein [Polyangiaceae bacterium]|nr:helix-turn-helix domain-containing protein [Polyangiaceae bacterium]